MAIDYRILQQIGVKDNAGALNIFQNALNQAQNREINQQQADQRATEAPFRQQLLEQQVNQGTQQNSEANTNRIIQSVAEFSPVLKPALQSAISSGNTEEVQGLLASRLNQLQQQGLPTDETVSAITRVRNGDIQSVINDLNAIDQQAISRGLVNRKISLGQRDFESKVALVKADPDLTSIEAQAAAIDLGIKPRASLSAQERIAQDKQLSEKVAAQKGAEASASETGKSKVQLKFKPQITKAIKLAEKEATERGEVLTELSRMEASLPGVKEVVNELLELSDIATSTLGGKAFDFAVKQSGFGATKGADAKAKMIAIVDNQVLPLLKETFGAAFTVQEGENLKASLVDPEASPSQKRMQLEAFLAQKERNIRTKQNQLGKEAPNEAGINEFAGFKVIR